MATSTDDERKAQDAAFMLVGEFMYHWAYLESSITFEIQSLLGLDTPPAEIILANVSFRDKTSIAETLSNLILTDAKLPTEATAAHKLFVAINNFSTNYRNLLAHHPFLAIADGIEFFRVRAKGKYEVQTPIWSKAFFEARFKEIDAFNEKLGALFKRLKAISNSANLVKALTLHHGPFPWTTETPGQPETANPPSRPPLGNTGSPPPSTNPPAAGGTPPDRKG